MKRFLAKIFRFIIIIRIVDVLSFCHFRRKAWSRQLTEIKLARYGPKEQMPRDMNGNFFDGQKDWENENAVRVEQQTQAFKALVEKIISTDNPEHLPGLMTRNIDLLLSMRGYEGVSIMKEMINDIEKTGKEEDMEKISTAIEYIISFVEEFVDQARTLDDKNKSLLGKIIRAIKAHNTNEPALSGAFKEENALDILLKNEKDNFTPGFLRYIDGECKRIQEAPRMTPESAAMLQIIRMIQARILEELGEDLGDGALVLGQLLGYEEKSERLAVLDTGLTVRGVEFAHELAAMTEEALSGFEKIPGGVDPSLILIVKEIDDRIRSFIANSEEVFQ